MHIVILGNGISGITSARFLRKLSDHRITVISAETDFFFSRTALMYIYMGHMTFAHTKPYEDWFWSRNRIDLIRAKVSTIDFQTKQLHFDPAWQTDSAFSTKQSHISYDKLILAVGSKPNRYDWPGQDLRGVGSLYAIDDLEALERHSSKIKNAVIVGGGLIGIELAEMLRTRNMQVTLLVRESSYWNNVLPKEESEMINRHILEHHIDLRLNTELEEIIDDGHGQCNAIITSTGERIDCEYVGLTAGVRPNVDFLKDTQLDIKKGILVDQHLQTNIDDVYAIGDCAQLKNPGKGRRPIEAVWYSGKIMGETLAYHMTGHNSEYHPGIWFNSAKFLDIEYQVYGNIQTSIDEHTASLYWEHEDSKKSVRINYLKETGAVIGFNLMGIRYRHEVCEYWIKNRTPIESVLRQLAIANFDPEFFKSYEREILATYNQSMDTNIGLASSRGLKSLYQVFK
jgi:NAD(P)H-nitrite reductase large subunit